MTRLSVGSVKGKSPRAAAIIIILGLVLSPAAVFADVNVQIIETDPTSPAVLGRWGEFSLRIGYNSDEPVRIYAQPYFHEQRVPAITGGTPTCGPGRGETFFWFAFVDPREVDSIRIFAESKTGEVLAQASLDVDLKWTGQPIESPRVPAEWVTRMKAAQQSSRARDSALMNSPLWYLVGGFMMLGVPGYFALQGWALWRLHDQWRKPAMLPLWPMGAVLLYTIYAYLDGSNLFPIVLIFTAPLASIYLIVVLGLRRTGQKAS